MKPSRPGEMRVGDIIEFLDPVDRGCSGILVAIIDMDGREVQLYDYSEEEHGAVVIHQASDGKFATWAADTLPSFNLTYGDQPQ